MFIVICVEINLGLDSFYFVKVYVFWCVDEYSGLEV